MGPETRKATHRRSAILIEPPPWLLVVSGSIVAGYKQRQRTVACSIKRHFWYNRRPPVNPMSRAWQFPLCGWTENKQKLGIQY
jgi:hypothetical protein